MNKAFHPFLPTPTSCSVPLSIPLHWGMPSPGNGRCYWEHLSSHHLWPGSAGHPNLCPTCPGRVGGWKAPQGTVPVLCNVYCQPCPGDRRAQLTSCAEELRCYLVLESKATSVKNPHIPHCISVKRYLWLGKGKKELSRVPEMFYMWVAITEMYSYGNIHEAILLRGWPLTLSVSEYTIGSV